MFGQVPDKIDIDLAGKPFATFHSGVAEEKALPCAAAALCVRKNHYAAISHGNHRGRKPGPLYHHRGLWFSYDDVNGVKFWENDPSYKDPRVGRIVATKAQWKPEPNTLETVFD